MGQDLDLNKKNAVAFYRTAYMGQPAEAVEKYVGAEYIQHNPDVEDGKIGFIQCFQYLAKEFPDKQIEFVRVIAEGNMVALHTHQTWPDGVEYVTMDFFGLMRTGRLLSIGMQYKRFLKKRNRGI